jgi:hypothetical protein
MILRIGDINSGDIYVVRNNPVNVGSESTVELTRTLNTNFAPSTPVYFFLRSLITTSSHTMEYIGSGTSLQEAVPGLGGVANPDVEAVSDNEGAVYFTSTNQSGNFRVGAGFTILQETGIIEGDTFKRAILSLVTPLILSLE